MRGQVIRTQSGFSTVQTSGGRIVCQLRGRLKKGSREGDIVAVGDWVEVTRQEDGTGMIENIAPRKSMFVRMAPLPQGEYQQIIVANPDQVALVFASAEPEPRLGMLDRYLVVAESQQVAPLIVVNKIDLTGLERAREIFDLYAGLNYPLIYTSAKNGDGIEQLTRQLTGKITLFTGPSGVGKTSLLNTIQPGLGLEVRKVSQATSKGRHTTVYRQMFPLDGGGYVVDTPGLKALALWDIEPEELDGYFPDISPLVERCQFSDCTHVHEPGCAVLEGLDEGTVNPHRYESYLRIRFGEED
jgi:ribosome biogenesis GTPase